MNSEKTKATLQVMVAAYVLYLVYGFKDSMLHNTGTSQILFVIAGIVMVVLSIIIIVRGIKILIQKEDE